MDIEPTREAEEGLAKVAARRGISAEGVATEAVEWFVKDELAVVDGIERALDDMRQGRVVQHDDVMANVMAVIDGRAIRPA